jgi:integrase
MREGELYGIALEDFDFDDRIVKVRRQIKNLGGSYIFALPKNDRERIIPLSDWAIRAGPSSGTSNNTRSSHVSSRGRS